MSVLKRKQEAGKGGVDQAKKRQKTTSDAKVKSSSSDHTKKSTDHQATKDITQKSLLSREQPAFPRGGAGPLTLLEQKKIRAKANRDVDREIERSELFANNAKAPSVSEESELDLSGIDEKQTFAQKKPRKRQEKKSTKTSKTTDSVAIDSVSHKRLTDGSLLLGRVSHIASRELTISLPNNLIGYVPFTAISQQFSSKLEKALKQEPNEEDDTNAEDDDLDIDLRNHFSINQLLRVAVQDVEDETSSKKEPKKRINLSINPSHVNKGLSRKTLVVGSTVQAAVVSVEDHGIVVDIGLDQAHTGFIADTALPTGLQLSSVEVGTVYLCNVSATSSKGKTIQLSADLSSNVLAKTAPSIEAYLPGTLVEVLLTHVTPEGLAGKVLGHLDVTADRLHSGAYLDQDSFDEKYQVGQKINGRLIATFPLADNKRLAFSVLDHLVNIEQSLEDRLEISSVVDRAQVVSIAHGLGVYLSLPSSATGFAHISRLSDSTIDTLSQISGPFKIGTEHQARIIDFNAIDGLYVLSLERSVIEQPFLRLVDVQPGVIVKGTIEKVLVAAAGVHGLLVKISPGITGFVSSLHFSDAALKHPEKKFREGMSVKARVLSVDTDRRRLDLTLKKSLVNSDQPVWSSYNDIQPGQSAVGTLVKVDSKGAIVQFYGQVKGRLPVSEMSEAYIKDAQEHFKVGQVLTLHVLKIDAESKRLTLSARDTTTAIKNETKSLKPGTLMSGTVFEKSSDDLTLRLEPDGVIARLVLDHVADGSEKKRKSALEKIRVGQKLDEVLVLELKGRQATLSNKATLRKAAEDGTLLTSYEQLIEGKIVTGFVSNITDNRVFVRFAQGITGVINKDQIPEDQSELVDFGMNFLQAVSGRISQIDYKGATPRFWLSMKTSNNKSQSSTDAQNPPIPEREIVEPVDENLTSYHDLVSNAVVKARITSVKDTQINVELAKGIQGRVDVSEIFDRIEDIHDRKRPLKQFSVKQVLDVKILGQHDSRTYKFLPLSHRSSKNVVFELSARPSVIAGQQPAVLKLEDLKVGETYPVFVNNVADRSLMVNVSPAVRGRIRASEVSNDLSLVANLAGNFPVGSALKAKVVSVDIEKNRLDLSAKNSSFSKSLTIEDIAVGEIVGGRISKITDQSLVVQLSDSLIGNVDMIDMADDFELADLTRFQKNEIVRAYVLQIDQPNKRVYLSLRPSKILSSALTVADPEVSLQQLEVGNIRRGFVANVSDKGLFVTLAQGLRAFVRVTNLSDEYLKEWKDHFQKNQLVQGKVIALDKDSGHIRMSLRKSHIDGTYRPPVTFNDLQVGEIVEAKVAKIETFGIFVVVSNSANVRGLCHRSEIAEKRIEDATKLGFSEGDLVKVKVLKIDPNERRVNFGMKASYFGEASEAEAEDSGDEEDPGMVVQDDDDDDDSALDTDQGVAIDMEVDDIDNEDSIDVESDDASGELDNTDNTHAAAPAKGLSVTGFDWYGMPSTAAASSKRPADVSDNEEKNIQSRKKKRKPEIMIDRTGDLDKDGPQSVDDFERLLLSEPGNAQLWVQFMAFHMDLGDIDAAREVGEKALKSIGITQETEKQAIWIALLNLETAFGEDDTVEATLQRACETMDAEDMHTKLASIYIQSGKHDKADELFQTMTKRFTQDPKLWENYASFLFDTLEEPARARALLSRALQALPPFTHFDITKKFAQLEFKTKTGVPEEGRTRFQGLINLYPKRLDLFNIMIDLEMKLGDADQVRGVFEQALSKKLKPAKAKPFFQRWLAFEKKQGDTKKIEEVEARAARWVQEYQKSSA
ncbi:rRNA biogenesis protein rrp5 [Lithohypha guttulata]|nr:rRNA biogenesis protein rrp5 [Lithohypha guttulata]